jgi:RNase P subunit RPR2
VGKERERQVIRQRLDELFELALIDEKNARKDRIDRKYNLIYLYSRKYKVPLTTSIKLWTCRKCETGIYANGGHIRIHDSRIVVHCGNCGYIRRYNITRR